uniref:Uncharacterized protein n=1 Tax=Brassica oleracea var. oleracea TaxID=109376 RepID=A0A0D3AZ88_BRAOL
KGIGVLILGEEESTKSPLSSTIGSDSIRPLLDASLLEESRRCSPRRRSLSVEPIYKSEWMSETRPVPRRESPWGLLEGHREPKAHRCNDRVEDVVQIVFEALLPLRHLEEINKYNVEELMITASLQCTEDQPSRRHVYFAED